MSCSNSGNITPASYPVGKPLTSGNPNEWNIGAGNYYKYNANPFLPDPQNTSTANQIAGGRKRKARKHKTRKHKKAKRNNIKRKRKTHKRKHKKMHKKKTYRRKHKKHSRKHKKRTRRHRMKGGGRGPPPLTPQFLVNSYRQLESGALGLIDGWNGKPQAVSPLPTSDQYRGKLQDVMIQKPIDLENIYQAAGKAAGSI